MYIHTHIHIHTHTYKCGRHTNPCVPTRTKNNGKKKGKKKRSGVLRDGVALAHEPLCVCVYQPLALFLQGKKRKKIRGNALRGGAQAHLCEFQCITPDFFSFFSSALPLIFSFFFLVHRRIFVSFSALPLIFFYFLIFF